MTACIHHNNGKHRLFVDPGRLQPNLGPVFMRQLERSLRRDPDLRGRLHRPARLDIVTCTNRAEKQYAERWLEFLGLTDFTDLGRHLPAWKHIFKLELIVEHIRRNPAPDLLLHLDAPDTLVTGDLQGVVDFFDDNPDCDLLAGAEKNSAPGSASTRNIKDRERQFLARIEQFESGTYTPPFIHLNAGCFAGRKGALLDILDQALAQRMEWELESRLHHGDFMYNDDQLVLREMHRQRYPSIRVDDGNRLFQNLYAIRKRELSSRYVLPGGIPLIADGIANALHTLKDHLRRRLSWGQGK